MSLPITPTPILKGLEAARFMRKLQTAGRHTVRRKPCRLSMSKKAIITLIKRCRGG